MFTKYQLCMYTGNFFCRHGCETSEEIFWKLRSIQAFIQDLHWPDEVFGEHMTSRLKLMAADMAEACVTRCIYNLLT